MHPKQTWSERVVCVSPKMNEKLLLSTLEMGDKIFCILFSPRSIQ